jgi:DNA primase
VENQVEEIKKKLDIVEVINHYLPLKKRGRHFIACCPFHSEKTPSFTVSQELQIFKCFGCGKAGDIFTFVQEYDHVDFKDALEDLAKMAGVTIVHSQQLTEVEHHRKRLIDLNYEAAKFYNYILTSHPLGKPALDYVLKRGITLESVKKFKIGFSPSNSLLISNYLQKKSFKNEEMIATGTFGYSRYGRQQLYDRFQDRLVFPLADFRDRILGFSGRILPGSPNPNLAKYINSPETDIYHKSQMLFGLNLAKDSIKKQNSVIVVEGEFDMISPFQAGIDNIVAIKGTAFTPEQLQLLHRYTDNLILGLDADFAGNNAARKSIELADSLEFDIRVISLEDKYKDPDEAVAKDFKYFKNQVEHPVPVWDFIISSAFKNNDPSSVKGKKDILAQVLPFLVKINNSVIRSDYFNKLASQIGSSVESIVEESQKYNQKVTTSTSSIISSPSPDKSNKIDRLEEYLLTVIFSSKKPSLLSKKIDKKIDFTLPRFKNIFVNLVGLKDDFEPQTFADTLSPELVPVFQSLFLASSYLNLDSHQRLSEINKTINQMLDITLKEKLVSLSSQIAQAESLDQVSLVEELESEYNHTLTKLSKIQSTKS